MAQVAADEEPATMRRRLDALNAELSVLRAAVDLRSRLLHEQSVALTERDARIAEMSSELDRRQTGDLPRQAVRRVRRVIGRVVRTGLRQT